MDPNHSNAPPADPNAAIAILREAVLQADLTTLREMIHASIPESKMPPNIYLESLSEARLVGTLRACLPVFILSLGTKVPRQMQLEAAMGALDGQDVIVLSHTESGKTLIMTILLLLRSDENVILILPYKRLQHTR